MPELPQMQALAERLDTSDEWIVRRTGIRERRHLLEHFVALVPAGAVIDDDDSGSHGCPVSNANINH